MDQYIYIYNQQTIFFYQPAYQLTVSISLIFPLLNHSSRIFFRDITNDAKKSLKPLGHMLLVGSVPQVKMDGPWNQKNVCITVKNMKVLLKLELVQKLRKRMSHFLQNSQK